MTLKIPHHIAFISVYINPEKASWKISLIYIFGRKEDGDIDAGMIWTEKNA